MQHLSKLGNLDVAPNTITYNAVINAYTNTATFDPNAAKKAEKLITEMNLLYIIHGDNNVRPDVTSFNSVLNALSRSGLMNDADYILEKMNSELEYIKPNRYSIGFVLNGYARLGNVKRVEQLLALMQRLHDNGQKNIRPNYVDFTALIHAYSKSKQLDRMTQVESILHMMEEAYEKNGDTQLQPNIYTYTNVMKVCMTVQGTKEKKKKSFLFTWAIFRKVQDLIIVKRDEILYDYMFRCCSNLISHSLERFIYAEIIFQQCYFDGLAGKYIMKNIQKNLGKNFLDRMLHIQSIFVRKKKKRKFHGGFSKR